MADSPCTSDGRSGDNKSERDGFASHADEGNASLLREVVDLILDNKKWWLVPVVLVLLVIGMLGLLMTSAIGPFIYPLF